MKLLPTLVGFGLLACISAYGDLGYDREDKGILNPAAEPSAPTRPRNRRPHPGVFYKPLPSAPIVPVPHPSAPSYGAPKQDSSYPKSESGEHREEKAPPPIYAQSSYTVHLEPYHVPGKEQKKDDGHFRPSYDAPIAQGYHAHSRPSYDAPIAHGYHAHSAPAPPVVKVPAVPSYAVTTPQVTKSIFQVQGTPSYSATTAKPKPVAKPTVRPVFIPAYQPVQTLYPLQFLPGFHARPAYRPEAPKHHGKGSEEDQKRKKEEEEEEENEEEEEEEEGGEKDQRGKGKGKGGDDGGYRGSAPHFRPEGPFPAFNVHAPAFPAFPPPAFPAYQPEAAPPAYKPPAPAVHAHKPHAQPTPAYRPQVPAYGPQVPAYKPQVTITLPAYQPQRPSFPAYQPPAPSTPAYRPQVTEAPAYPQQTVTDYRIVSVHAQQAPSAYPTAPAPGYGQVAEPEVEKEEKEEEFYPDDLSAIPGEPGRDYPQMALIPQSSFTCENKLPGYYADIDTQCQVWHICDTDYRKESFLCPNGTIYNQEAFVCDWWYNVDCSKAANYFSLNEGLYKVPVKKVEIEAPAPQYEQKSQDGYGSGHVQQSTYQQATYQVSQPSYVVSVPAVAIQKPLIYSQPAPVKSSKKSKGKKTAQASYGYDQEKSQSKKSHHDSEEDSRGQGY